MTKLIDAIELNRIDRRRHTMAIEAQTTEMRREHGELIFLMSRTMNELNWNIMWLVYEYVQSCNIINYEFNNSFIC